MNSRRKFLVKGGLATTALLAAKPLQTIAGSGSGGTNAERRINFLHTADPSVIKKLRSHPGNNVLLTAQENDQTTGSVKFDASLHHDNAIGSTANNYRIIYKGKFKIGVLSAATATPGLIEEINELSGYLKKELDCHTVICLSRLGYKTRSKIDDLRLAEQSTALDLIIAGDPENVPAQPMVVLSKQKHEVIIHAERNQLGSVEIEFDAWGKKRSISFDKTAKQLS